MELQLNLIRIDGGTQPRAEINLDTVAEYSAAFEDGANFPPIDVFFDGVTYWLADGFHRWHAATKAKLQLIDATIHTGTVRDAILFSVGANAAHGLQRSNADKRRAVKMLLDDPEWSQWSSREICRRCGVHHSMVDDMRRARKMMADSAKTSSTPHEVKYTTSTGKTGIRPVKPTVPVTRSEHTTTPSSTPPKTRGIGIEIAHEAIACLKKIPPNDALRLRAFQIVSDWIVYNSGDK